jgi:SynChlorMet cassette protein ScmC
MELITNRSWEIIGNDPEASQLVSRLKEVMQLDKIDNPAWHLTVHIATQQFAKKTSTGVFDYGNIDAVNEGNILCSLKSADDTNSLVHRLRYLSQILCLDAQKFGGLLMHSALAEWKGKGIMFAGPWGSGKTTISQHLRLPWRALSDDLTLLIPDQQRYLAHPWPTWSRFVEGGPGGSWNVQYTVPLCAIFLLSQDVQDVVEPIGKGQAACALVDAANQAWRDMPFGERGYQALRLQRFDNACRLAVEIPVYLLRHRLHGAFWQEVERVLE